MNQSCFCTIRFFSAKIKAVKSGNIEYSICIPVFNSEKTLQLLHNKLITVFKRIPGSYEIIFIDDNSRDSSWQELERLQKNDKKLSIIRLMRNYGQHNALMCGFRHAKGTYIITLDDDLQNPPSEIPLLLKEKQHDIVYGTWEENSSLHRRLLSLISRVVANHYIHASSKQVFTSFRVIHRRIIDEITSTSMKFLHIDTLLSWYSTDVAFVEVKHEARKYGRSNYTMTKLFSFGFNLLVNLTDIPLRATLFLGFFFSFVAMTISGFYFVQYLLYHIGIPGYASLIVTITFFAGVELLSIGIICLYLDRIYGNTVGRPMYAIRQKKP